MDQQIETTWNGSSSKLVQHEPQAVPSGMIGQLKDTAIKWKAHTCAQNHHHQCKNSSKNSESRGIFSERNYIQEHILPI